MIPPDDERPAEPPVESLEAEPIPPDERRAAAEAGAAARRASLAARDRRRAWMIAIGADVLQWVLFPLFLGGGAVPWDVALDLFVTLAMVRLVGFHIAFAPAFVLELVPVANFVPTWTLAMWVATRGKPRPRT